jgi:hypothetical protein
LVVCAVVLVLMQFIVALSCWFSSVRVAFCHLVFSTCFKVLDDWLRFAFDRSLFFHVCSSSLRCRADFPLFALHFVILFSQRVLKCWTIGCDSLLTVLCSFMLADHSHWWCVGQI